MAAEKFWDKGIRFECQGTGRCCMSRGEYGYVYFTLEDRRRIAGHLKMRTSDFSRKYLDNENGWFFLKDPEKNCIFLDGKACTVYEGRPTQCRTWPFWPENMKPRTWKTEVTTFCPGIGKGKLYTPDEIRALLAQDPVAD